MGIPVADEFTPYLSSVITKLRSLGVRAEIDKGDDRMQKKIRNHTKDKIPFQLIAGAEDQQTDSVSFRYRNGEQVNSVTVDDAIALILDAIETKKQV
jgi:threonyl-tRNA synthetase